MGNFDILRELSIDDNDKTSITEESDETKDSLQEIETITVEEHPLGEIFNKSLVENNNDLNQLNFSINENNTILKICSEDDNSEMCVLERLTKQDFREKEVKQKQNYNKNTFINYLSFVFRYMSTSAIIFLLLLVTTNYQAYLHIADSYINKGEMEQTTKSLINSVEATNLNLNEYSDDKKRKESNSSGVNSFKKFTSLDKEDASLDIHLTPYENRIIIPKIGKNIPLIDIKNRTVSGQSELNDIFMKELENGVIRYPGSAKPGELGNSFVFGHSSNFPWIKGEYNDVFALLDKLSENDDIIVYYNQKKYTYKISRKSVISPGNISVLKPKENEKELSIMTCWPIGTTLNRLVVTGKLVEVENHTKDLTTENIQSNKNNG